MHRPRGTFQRLFALFAVVLLGSLASPARADVDVTAKVQVIKTSLLYDRATGTSYLDVSLKNTSTTPLVFPAQLVIPSVSPATVTVSNADGTTADGKPYLQFTRASNQLNPGETTAAKRLKFKNPTALRFSYSLVVSATVPEAFGQVGAGGGTIVATASGVTVEIPAGALATTVPITISEAKGAPLFSNGKGGVGKAIELGPSGTAFNVPVTVTLSYDDESLTTHGILDDSVLSIYTYDQTKGTWMPLQMDGVDTDNKTVTALTNHFTTFQINGDSLIRPWPPIKNSAYPAVLFIHGVQLAGAYGDPWETFGQEQLTLLPSKLVNIYGLSYDTGRDITTSAFSVALALKRIQTDLPGRPINVIAHSMGGLLARSYVENLAKAPAVKNAVKQKKNEDDAKWKGDVGKILMMGTPNHGSNWAWPGDMVAFLWDFNEMPSFSQMLPENYLPFLNNLNSATIPASLAIDVAYGTLPPVLDSDGVVSVSSALLAPEYTPDKFRRLAIHPLASHAHVEVPFLWPGVAHVDEPSDDVAQLMLSFALDSDSDGVPDGIDKCPNTAMTDQVNEDGCSSAQIGPAPTYTDPFTHMDFVYVAPGTFQMGDTFGDCSLDVLCSYEQPVHTVTLTNGFYVGKTEVTQAQWQAVVGSNPSYFQPSNGYPVCPTCPVDQVSWNDIQAFITALNSRSGKTYRLPTEAEWEYAAKGGPQPQGYKYAGSNTPGLVAWTGENNTPYGTKAVGGKLANGLGLYDMSGNVWEWVQDWYGAYSSAAQTNPPGPASGSHRVIRGGGWFNFAYNARVSDRDYSPPSDRGFNIGFRLALSP